MAQEYSLQSFIRDMDDITGAENSPSKIVAAARPLLAKLVQRPDCIEPKFKKRGATEYGRYMLHRCAPVQRYGRRLGARRCCQSAQS
jgi:predicted metal-dependent enzyme (double-stranded beta helix superfamily)